MTSCGSTIQQGTKTPLNQNTISCQDARNLTRETALKQTSNANHKYKVETISLFVAINRIAAQDYVATRSTPPADTSAMDGYAVCSDLLQSASPSSPIICQVKGCMVAGQRSTVSLPIEQEHGIWPCVEIATGSRFPVATRADVQNSTRQRSFDAVIPYELTTIVEGPGPGRYVQITRPAKPCQHRRFAGCDIAKGTIIVRKGTVFKPQYIGALASLGLREVVVQRRLKVGVWSTGNELLGHGFSNQTLEPENNIVEDSLHIFDSNGPFLVTALKSMGVDADYLGIVDDDGVDLERELRIGVKSCAYDAFITTGAVSMGKHDFVKSVLEKLSAEIIFHKTRIRPGHPLLLATLSPDDVSKSERTESQRTVAFFGLPGNPVAAAVGFRFFATFYLLEVQDLPEEVPKRVVVQLPNTVDDHKNTRLLIKSAPAHLDHFWHGRLTQTEHGERFLVAQDQSPAKVGPLTESDAWVHVPQGHGDVVDGIELDCYSLLLN